MLKKMENEISDFDYIKGLVENGENVFITGPAGTGKSYLLNKLKMHYKNQLVLTSTTGISAINIEGLTIHSWAGVSCMNTPVQKKIDIFLASNFGPIAEIKSRIKKCRILAIDEVSMLSAYSLEYLDTFFKGIRKDSRPFGGMQVLFFGDFMQLPPVFTVEELKYKKGADLYCFESPVWEELNFKPMLLNTIYRQDNLNFSKLLCRIRLGQFSYSDHQILQTRYFDESRMLEDKLHIFPMKTQASKYNKACMDKLVTPEYTYKSYDVVNTPLDLPDDLVEYRKDVYRKLNKTCPAKKELTLKVGCRVMLVKNLNFQLGLVNGVCGEILELANSYVIVRFDNGQKVKLEACKFEYAEGENILAKRFQIPLVVAYAITIHKAQGLTLDEVVINFRKAFSPGQVYVALSRVKSLNGLYITGYDYRKLAPDSRVRYFYSDLLQRQYQEIIEHDYARLFA